MEHVWSVEYTTISTLVKYSWDTLFELRNYDIHYLTIHCIWYITVSDTRLSSDTCQTLIR